MSVIVFGVSLMVFPSIGTAPVITLGLRKAFEVSTLVTLINLLVYIACASMIWYEDYIGIIEQSRRSLFDDE